MVFLDLIEAFDNVILKVLAILLSKYGLLKKIIAFIQATTYHRNLLGYAAGVNLQKRTTSRGLPQGSILNPILFDLYLAMIENCLPLPVHILMYADDIAIYCTHESLNYIKNHLNIALDSLYTFLKNICLSISPAKSMYIIFSNQRARTLRLSIRRCQFSLSVLGE